ncbi:MAG: ribosome small subunit-dependent GTPase A [Sulfobacillus thermosulfidooxidans]|uniref:Small ribosomal subunit biogenesis GTPase RsgA n=1 Tax=Sulfobacillus thermosulfidooxidans TaxID=28034 RepID=A0A2T2X619_SULTH|nr:MAG: ribosome small subunit-dependent GTPase A [Sulfobacillus thermosulfidooxidans]
MQGLVVLLEANRPTVETDDGKRYLCYLRGKIKRDAGRILVGDRVEIMPTDPGEAIITKVLPRSHSLFRPPVANVSGLFVIFSFTEPRGSLELLDKRLVMAHILNVEAEIVVTKTDLVDDREKLTRFITLYKNIGYRVWATSVTTGEGIPEFLEAPRTGIWVMVGESGAGKSSLAKALLPHEELDIQGLSRIGRGQQTTRWVRLLKTRQFWLADTPGYTALEMSVKDPQLIRQAFWEWDNASCRFPGCFHIDEPGCDVLPKVMQGIYDPVRYEHYRLILNQWVKRY